VPRRSCRVFRLLAIGGVFLCSTGLAHAEVSNPFPGVTLVKDGGKAMAVADLCREGVSMRVTKYGERKATPQQWGQAVGAQVAINGDFFDFPGWTWVIGRSRGAGESWPAAQQNKENRMYFQFGPGIADLIEPASTEPNPAATEILGGHNTIIRDGHSLAPNFDGDGVILGSYRRTGVGLNGSRSKVFLFASNTALNGAAMADAMFSLAAQAGQPDLDVATNEDGGGSSQMFVAGQGQIIDSGRQVNNHLGIFAKGSGGAPNCWHRPPTHPLPTQAGTCGVIKPGEGLGPRQVTSSCDGRFSLIQQSDGNLVLYGPVGKPLWFTNTQSVDGYALTMQGDGNAVQYSAYGRAAWQSNTPSHPGARLAVQADGNLVVYDGNTALWASLTFGTPDMPTTPTQPTPKAPSACGVLLGGEGLAHGESVVSCDGRFHLKMQGDGNLVLYTLDEKALWSASTASAVGYTATMGADGNFVVATPYQITAWSSDTTGHAGARLAIQDDGNLVVYEGSKALWNSGTSAKDAPYPPSGQAGSGGGAQEGQAGQAGNVGGASTSGGAAGVSSGNGGTFAAGQGGGSPAGAGSAGAGGNPPGGFAGDSSTPASGEAGAAGSSDRMRVELPESADDGGCALVSWQKKDSAAWSLGGLFAGLAMLLRRSRRRG
jgi:hypothetical protein